MQKNGTKSVSIIGGADGPTRVFIAGRIGKKPLKDRVRNYFYKCKRKRMENKIHAGGRTLKEVIAWKIKDITVIRLRMEKTIHGRYIMEILDGQILKVCYQRMYNYRWGNAKRGVPLACGESADVDCLQSGFVARA